MLLSINYNSIFNYHEHNEPCCTRNMDPSKHIVRQSIDVRTWLHLVQSHTDAPPVSDDWYSLKNVYLLNEGNKYKRMFYMYGMSYIVVHIDRYYTMSVM
jgi:hypothetical protein